MDLSFLQDVAAPVSDGAPSGEPPAEGDEDFGFVEQELIKRSGVARDSVDWTRLRAASLSALTRSKHVVALSGLCAALAIERRADALAAAADACRLFIDRFGESAHPAGARAARRRSAVYSEIAQTLARAARGGGFAGGENAALAAAFGRLRPFLAGAQASCKEIDEAIGQLAAAPSPTPAPPPPNPVAEAPPAAMDAPARPAVAADKLAALGPRELSELRREIRAFADRLSDLEPGDPAGWRLRRYGAWLRQNGPPHLDAEGRAEIPPMPKSIADEFEAALKAPSLAHLGRLEERLFSDPYWLDGHRIAARMAEACGWPRAARAIQESLAERIARFPAIRSMVLKNGAPMASPDVLAWLDEGAAAPVLSAEGAAPWTLALDKALERLKADPAAGLREGLALLDVGAAEAKGGRAQACWRLATADFLKAAGLDALAGAIWRDLEKLLRTPELAAWEPELANALQARLAKA